MFRRELVARATRLTARTEHGLFRVEVSIPMFACNADSALRVGDLSELFASLVAERCEKILAEVSAKALAEAKERYPAGLSFVESPGA